MIAMGETKTKSDKFREKISNWKMVLHIKYVVLHRANSALRKLILYDFLSITNILLNFFIIDLNKTANFYIHVM